MTRMKILLAAVVLCLHTAAYAQDYTLRNMKQRGPYPQAAKDAQDDSLHNLWTTGEALDAGKLLPVTLRPRGRAELNIYQTAAPAIPLLVNDIGSGSGFFISKDGWMITNHHVIKDAAYNPEMQAHTMPVILGKLKDGVMGAPYKAGEAKIWSFDRRSDLALLKLAPAAGKDFPFLKIAAKAPLPTDKCMAIGHPGIGAMWSARSGTVTGSGTLSNDTAFVTRLQQLPQARRTAVLRMVQLFSKKTIQTDLGIHGGDSGGPLLNMAGEVTGVTVAHRVEDSTSLSLHVHLDELLKFNKFRRPQPVVLVPSATGNSDLELSEKDADGDGAIDIVVGAAKGNIGFVALQLSPGAKKPHFAMYRRPRITYSYDTSLDGVFDLILRDEDGDLVADTAYELTKSGWRVRAFKDNAISGNLFKTAGPQKAFTKWNAVLRKVHTMWTK